MTEFLKQHPIQTTLGLSATVGILGAYAYGKLQSIKEYNRLQALTLRKQEERKTSFLSLKREYKLTAERKVIIETPLQELVDKLQLKVLSATQVLEAFIAKALEVNDDFNCVVGFVPQALEWAQKLDSLPTPKGPLHGLPFCIKDDYDVKGMDTTHGLAKHLYQPLDNSAVLVKALRDLGGVPFCKTNVPQTLVGFASRNPIYGETLNPLNPKLGPGGSSSGTGCLVGAAGAFFGLGSDFGGSGRIPAHFCGISSIKPTAGRLSVKGNAERFLPGFVGISGATAVMAQSSKQLSMIFKALTEGNDQRKYDSTVVPIPWNYKSFSSRHSLRIGYYSSVAAFPAAGDTEKVILKAKAALEERGHTLVPFPVMDEEEGWIDLLFHLRYSDLGHNLRLILEAEEVAPSMQGVLDIINKPCWLRKLQASCYEFLPGNSIQRRRRIRALRAGFNANTTQKLWECLTQRKQLIERTLRKMEDLELDLVIGPTFPFPALRVENHAKLMDAIIYTAFWNLVNFPAGTTPFGIESGDNIENYDDQSDVIFKLVKTDMKESIGMPIGVQVIGKPFEDEQVLRVLVELEEIRQKMQL